MKLALLVVAALCSSAAADTKRMVGILDVRVVGVSEDLKAKFEKQLEQQLDSNQYWLANRAAMHDRLKFSTHWTDGCLIGDCLVEVRTQTQAQLVLLAALEGSGTSFGFVVTLIRTDTGRVLAQKTDRCDVCTVNEAMTDAILATIQLLNDVPAKLPDDNPAREAADLRGKLTVESQRAATTSRHQNRVGKVLALTGVLVAAGGAVTYFGLDRPAWAMGVAGAGGGMVAGGVILLAF